MTPKLKPCPFCGGRASEFAGRYGFSVVECTSLDCPVNPRAYSRADWNTRVPKGVPTLKRVGTRSKASRGKARG